MTPYNNYQHCATDWQRSTYQKEDNKPNKEKYKTRQKIEDFVLAKSLGLDIEDLQ
ncbi:hypothetical protein L5M28_01120 [Shewanella sp. SW32]|uniref:hypothetical protein n=1 Tax=unclassified Shewanella TaxID=196818 RepID=UPI0021D9E3C1|nr:MULTISPECIES: hypothetical protein [unclassified Shewanella]MCU7961194.1 hypothetical protein [Shewanella sp. SW32]MCU7969276.1 hypothetical protein [Shewanella sp. SW29]